ncbi:unnamed protein product [Rotaria socialis]|uniref:Uncharacterized protein n=1 Tax=Rotaria socialis TaxID=392032 RepID=A0A818CCX1_9BILA|nr:unnamed protein product [Rotaria socialis]CAF3425952.1 unnamed protein product [Rotaria socialis]CAF3533121.1 unnamed protein product [Rotaria socialis]CAF3544274.1 unnamed protein product [Rotaria socialis]
MFSIIHLLLFSLILIVTQVSTENQFGKPITCYTKFEREETRDPKSNTLLGYGYENAHITVHETAERESCEKVGCTCFSYKGVCSRPLRGSTHHSRCTPDDISKGTIKWHHGWTSAAKCQQMGQEPQTYLQLTCCHTDRCNNQMEQVITYAIPQETVQLPNLHEHQAPESASISENHPPPQYNHYAQESSTPRWHETYKPPQMYNEPRTTYYKYIDHSTTSRLVETPKPSQLYKYDVRNLTTSYVPSTPRPNEVNNKCSLNNKALISSSLSSLMICFSLVFCFCFI